MDNSNMKAIKIIKRRISELEDEIEDFERRIDFGPWGNRGKSERLAEYRDRNAVAISELENVLDELR